MKKETVVTAVVFLGVGFIAGYITDAQLNWRARQRAAAGMSQLPAEMPGSSGVPGAAAGGMGQVLPEGHPPIDISSIARTLEEQAAQSPNDPEPRLRLANYLYDQRRWQQAIEWYQKALAIDPKNVNARTDLGTAYFNLGRPQEALREYRKTLEIDPEHQPTLFNSIVVNLEGARDLDAAQQAWERLSKLNPNYPGLGRLKQTLDAARAGAGAPLAR